MLRTIAISLLVGPGALTTGCDRGSTPGPVPVVAALDNATTDVRADDPARAVLREADASIAKFWRWWASLSAAQRLEVATHADGPLFAALSEHVEAIAPAMAFEFHAGVTSEHAMALSGEGDAVLRLLAERWRRAGPGDDATWTFHTARQPMAPDALLGATLRFEGIDVPLKDVRLDMRQHDDPAGLDIGLWHPAFAKLSVRARETAVIVLIDQAIGEDAALTWITTVDALAEAPKTGHDLLALAREVAELAAATKAGTYTLGEGTHPTTGEPVVFRLHASARRWDHAFHDTLCTVTIPYTPANQGMPDALTLDAIDARETAITDLLGKQAVHFGTVTGAGSRRVWFYVDGDTDAVARVERWAATIEPAPRVASSFDPAWEKASE